MQNTYLFIRGSIGIKKGLGLDEIEFDLSDKTGLVALSGPNGKGKSTTLELMSLYRTLASRKGALRHHFFLRDSRVEQKFLYDGDEYHIIWKIDSGSDRSEAFVIVNGESVVDGKNKEYDKYIVEKFGSQNLFYNSVFCAQGSENMSNMTAGKIKELFVEFLRIERFEEWRKKSAAGVEYYQKKLNVLSGEMDICKEQLFDFGDIDAKIKHNDISIASKELDINAATKDIEKYEKAIIECQAKSEKQKADIERKAEIETALKELISKRDKITEKIKTETDAYYNKKAVLEANIKEVDAILADREKILNASTRIESLEKWERYFSDCYECTIDEQAIFDTSIKNHDRELSIIAGQIKELDNNLILDGLTTTLSWLESRKTEIEQYQTVLNGKLNDAEHDFSLMQAKSELAACRDNIGLSIDPDCKSTTCPAIDMVAKAKKDLPRLEQMAKEAQKSVDEKIKETKGIIEFDKARLIDIEGRIQSCGQAYAEHFAEIEKEKDELKKNVLYFNDTKELLISDHAILDEFKDCYKSRLTGIRSVISNLKEIASRKSLIDVAEEKKSSLAANIEQLVSQFEAWECEQTGYFDELSNDILTREESILKIDESIDESIDKTIESLCREKRVDKLRLDGFVKTLDELKANAAVLSNDVEKKEKLSASLNEKKEIKKAFEKELTEWDYLRLACSKTGLQALEIDGAAPLVTAEANALFGQAYDLDWQIKIITQDPETGKEVFWIKVIRDGGVEDDFSNLSGGEKVWVARALNLGMTLVSKKKSGRDFRTIFMDESDGALDDEKAIEFIRLYRSMLTTGDFDTCFFISHNSDLVSMADHKIDFNSL
jgi:exonuclease SbcC